MRSRQFRSQYYGRGVVYVLNIQREKRAFRSAFNFLIERLSAPVTPDFWDETARKILEVADVGDALGMDLLCAAFAHLERVRGG